MEFNENLDFAKLINSRGSVDNVTPHKVAVVGFIREFGLLKMESKAMTECSMAPKYRKDFCILALKLIQCPDMEFKELENLLTNGKYNLLSVHLQNFCVCLQNIYANGVSALTDCVTSTVDKLMMEQSETNPCLITRSSVLGFYLRRVMLQLDKLTFVQLVALYKSFCLYYQKGRPGLMIRSLSKEKLNNMESNCTHSATEDLKHTDISLKMAVIDRDHGFEEGQWSKKQAELFTAQQATLLQINESKAHSPKQLQKIINEIIHDLPEYSDIHFLSFLNCIRMKEFSGAQDSLYNCFDRAMLIAPSNSNTNNSERNKHYRYAALNRAAMHTQFGHNEIAMEGVAEAMCMAQQAGDGACLATAAAWGARAGGPAGRALLPRGVRTPRAPAAAAATAHLLAQHTAVNAAKPADVFNIVTRGDSINYLHSMTDLTLAGLANTAALWSLYGKTEMASVFCQLLLNLNTKVHVGGSSVYYNTEAMCVAAAGLAALGAARGDASLARLLAVNYAAPAAHHRAAAQAALYAGKSNEAEESILQLASYDRWESQHLKAEMFFLKGSPNEAIECLEDILDNCKTEDDSLHYICIRLKAMILKAEVQHCYSGVHSLDNSNIIILNDVLSTAKKYYLHYIAATTEMHIANVQLHLGCAKRALRIVKKVLPIILAHGGSYDIARALFLHTKCRIACAPTADDGDYRTYVLESCCAELENVKKHFQKVGAQSRLLEAWYLQAQLYNELGNIAARNQCACMFRQIETQNPVDVEHTNALQMMY